MDPIRTGLAGFGASARIFHAPFLATTAGFALKGVVERTSEESKRLYEWVEVHREYESLLADPGIDLVIISTPNATHYEFAKMALDAGKHVVVEKPFTITSGEGQSLLSLAMKHKKKLTVYHNRRFDGDFKTVQKILKEGLLGRLVEVEIRYERWANQLRKKAWKEEPVPGSTLLDDLGSHLIDQALCLFSCPERVFCQMETQRDGSLTTDAFLIRLMYSGFSVTLKAGMVVREPGAHFILHGTSGSFVKKGMDPQESQLSAGMSPRAPGFGVDPKEQWGTLNTEIGGLHFHGPIETLPGSYDLFYENLYQVIREEAAPLVSPEDALTVIRIIEAARESHQNGKIVDIDWN